jgi:hypothetical protein
MSNRRMNPMGHGIPNVTGVDQTGVAGDIGAVLPGYLRIGDHGMAEHQEHVDMGHHRGPANTLAIRKHADGRHVHRRQGAP